MSQQVFLFVESNSSGTGEIFLRKVQELQIQPILLSANPSQYHFSGQGLESIITDTSSEKSLIEICEKIRRQNKITGIASTSDYFIEAAAKLAKHFNLPGPCPEAISICRSKEKQRRMLLNAGIGVPEYRKVISVDEAANSANKIGFPVVIKPVAGSGSVGVRLCRNLDEVICHSEKLLDRTVNERGIRQRSDILVEQYIYGDEYSVETFGKEVVGITKKYLGSEPYFVETGHDFPALLPAAAKAVISHTVLKSLEILHLDWGPNHTEIRLNEKGVFVIEVNPRLAGGFIPELVRYSSGIDLIAETINLFLDRPTCLKRQFQFYSSIRFILSTMNGTLVKIDGLNEDWRLTGIEEIRMYKKLGETVTSSGDFRSRIGHVIAKGEVSQIVCEIAEKARRFINLSIDSSTNQE